MLFNYFILIHSFLLPKLVTINKKNNVINNVINNVKMGLDNNYDEYGNVINNTFNIYMNHELNSTNDLNNFPSFYKFLREREINELKAKEEYLQKRKNKILNKTNKTINVERYEIIEPSSKDLKLLSSLSTGEWMKTWIYEMVHVPDYFPTFMYQDMFRMREFSQKNNTKNYFYIGYYPMDVNLKHGPFYIGAFELVPNMREFRTFIIVQNPYHCADNIYDVNKIKDFKKELLALCNDSSVFFKFSNLQNTSDQRYFYSWLYEE
jgi:hypothetical protein